MILQSKKFLDDILYAIGLIEEFIADVDSFDEYLKDAKTRSAIERQIGIVGEAVNKFDKLESSNSLKNSKQIVGLRNRIIHAYDSIDDTVIWAIIKNHIPALKEEVIEKLNA